MIYLTMETMQTMGCNLVRADFFFVLNVYLFIKNQNISPKLAMNKCLMPSNKSSLKTACSKVSKMDEVCLDQKVRYGIPALTH